MPERIQPKKDRNWLVYRYAIESDMRKGAISKAITEYLEAIGYRQTRISPSMEFERGTTMASLYNPNPRSQKTIITIDIVGAGGHSIVEAVMRVNCRGNLPLSKDFDFWQTELQGIEKSLHYGYCDPRLSEYAADRAKWYSIAIMLGVFVAGTIAITALSMMMAFLP